MCLADYFVDILWSGFLRTAIMHPSEKEKRPEQNGETTPRAGDLRPASQDVDEGEELNDKEGNF